ncbi:ankyrin repeat-containing domain protein [Trichoderma afarasin]
MAPEKRSHDDYSVGWICALPKEQTAATAMLDERHPDLSKPMNDTNTYTLGSIGSHNVVIACLPKGQYGNNSAANVATLMIRAFPSIKVGLLVGIGGGVPMKVRLGDVVVSTPSGQYPGVVQWDLGKATEGGKFERTGALSNPPSSLLTALGRLETEYELKGSKIPSFLEELKARYPRLAKKYLKSASLQDLRFRADYAHIHEPFMDTQGATDGIVESSLNEDDGVDDECEESCAFCDKSKTVKRKARSMRVHHGLIASGNKVIKDALLRDEVNRSLGGDVLCFEMEAAGLMNNFPCLVIRGICDYCDSHKNKAWQEHAAAVAAAFAKEVLGCIQHTDVKNEQLIRDAMNEVKQDIRLVHEVAIKTKNHLDTLLDDNALKKQTETLAWLSPLEFPPLQHEYLRKCAPDTGHEFVKSDEVQSWMSTCNQTLFCQGVPGAGKTFQMAILVNNLMEKFRSDDTVGVAYLYYNFKKQQTQKAEHMLANIIKQLAQISRPFPESVHQLRERHSPTRTRPFLGELSDTLTVVIQSFSRVFILIDALDEGDDCERTNFLGQMFAVQEKSGFNLFATSRTINTITAKFEGSLSRNISPSRHDIFQFLETRMSELPLFVAGDIILQDEIKASVESAIGGMFLLAQLYINSLMGKRSPAALQVVLKDIRRASSSSDKSRVLEEAYDKSMERIQQLKGDLPCDGLLILSWIVKAKRQMKLAELQEALAVELGSSELNSDNIPTVEHITEACASLVVIEGDTLELVHYTAQEYFEHPNNKWMQKAHENIMQICMAYLSLSIFGDKPCLSQKSLNKRIENNPMYNYTATYWAYHTNEALNQDLEVSRAIEFLENGQIRGSWYQDLLYSHFRFEPDFIPAQLTALHVAAFFGLHDDVVSRLIEEGHSPNAKDSLSRMPIWWAAWNGHDRVIQLLIEVTTDLETKDVEYGSTPLHIAALLGYERIAELLLKKYSINSTSLKGWTPLSLALHHGHKILAELFVEKGANIEATGSSHQTPLAIAAMEGHLDAVKWLIEKGSNIEARDCNKQTPLMLATIGKHDNVIRYLIEKGANRKAMDNNDETSFTTSLRRTQKSVTKLSIGKGVNLNKAMSNKYTPLTSAINDADYDMVKLLIKRGANLDGLDKHGKTPLLTAIDKGNKNMIEFLIEKGAGLEVKGCSSGDTPLIFATKRNYPDIAKLLIQKGANLEARDDQIATTAVSHAAEYGFTEIIQLFLDNNANIETKDKDGDTPLGIAAYYAQTAVIQLLLENNANIETKNNIGRTPLSIAAYRGHTAVIQLLLNNNTNIETKDIAGDTPLSIAAYRGHTAAIQLFLDNKANIETKDIDSKTPLGNAAYHGQTAVIQLLLNNNANIETKDKDGDTPLGIAAYHGQTAAIQLLLDYNADINAKNNDKFTPLWMAVGFGNSSGTTVLLEHGADTDLPNKDTLMHSAVQEKKFETVLVLLEFEDVQVDKKDSVGRTPLSYAVEKGGKSIVKALLDSGKVDVNRKDKKGRTPLSYCTSSNVATLLLNTHKVDVNSKDNQGRKPVWYATKTKNQKLIELLRQHGARKV